MNSYDPKEIEAKWQKKWNTEGVYRTKDGTKEPKSYVLDMFPYPSGEGLHVGHPKGYIATDVYSRFKKMNGFNILHPMGFDAFGLPAENFAIKNKIHPRVAVEKNIAHFKEQLEKLGLNYDWHREINTTDPKFYKWTQWMFLKMFEKGLAYESYEPINWCPTCQTGLADEDLEDGKCERCGTPVERKRMRQWVLKIREYADRLLEDLETLDWPESIKESERNWIGRSIGAEIDFPLDFGDTEINARSGPDGKGAHLSVFTTRPDTLFGVTYLVLAPEHPWVTLALQHKTVLQNNDEVAKYVQSTQSKSDLERQTKEKDKTGVELQGVKAVNPGSGEKISIWTADYVLPAYGTGAIMAVPAHDERDHDFANKFHLPEKIVIEPVTGEPKENEEFRRSVVALVRDPKTLKILSIDWGEHGGNLLIGGGMDKGEDPIECAKREILEETGYKNVKFIAQSENIHHHYFASSKNVQREILATGLYFELLDEEKEVQNLEEDEKGKFKVTWISEKDAQKYITDPLHHLIFNKFILGKIYSGQGILIDSEEFNGLLTEEAKEKIVQKVGGEMKTSYRLRDWVFSRQRYWGEPIPIIHCEKCGTVPVPEKDLPVTLPEVEHYAPTGTGESPLADISQWVNTTCPKCGGKGKRETNTMPQWAGSSWYYLRYMDPQNDTAPVGKTEEKYWSPVDLYVGGAEHATRHLIYARFWHKFLYDIGVVSDIEPFKRLQNVGLIQAEDGRKMSKRYGNVINPDDVVEQVGADTLRVYEMFMGPFAQSIAWSTDHMVGSRRFLERVWKLRGKVQPNEVKSGGLLSELHKTIKKIGEDIEALKFNTAISSLMVLVRTMEGENNISRENFQTLLKLLSPFAPHITEELWENTGGKSSIHLSPWPKYQDEKIFAEVVKIGIQINGKVRDAIVLDAGISQNDALKKVLALSSVKRYLEGKKIEKTVFIPGKILSIVAK